MSIVKLIYLILGSVFLLLGLVGIIIPGLPTTPFLLLTAWLYAKGSDKFYNALINNKFLGKYISDYRKYKGVTLNIKIYSSVLMWIMISTSVGFFIENIWVKGVVIIAGIIGTAVMWFAVRTITKP